MDIRDKGLKLRELVSAYQAVDSSATHSLVVEKGLMTPEEYTAYEAYFHIESLAYSAGRTAENAVPHPDWNQGLPAEYVALKNRQKEVGEALARYNHILEGFHAFMPYRGYAELSAITDLAKAADALSQEIEMSPEYKALQAEQADLRRRIEPKERENSKVRRIQRERGDAYRAAQAKANADAQAGVLSQHAQVVTAGKQAQRAKHRRVQQRQQDIIQQMRTVLNS